MALGTTIASLVIRLTTNSEEVIRDLDKAQKRVERVGKSLSNMGRNLTTHVTLPLAAAGTAAVMAAVDLETAFTGVIKTVDATEAELAQLNEGFKEMAREIPVSIDQLYGIGEAAGQLGIETQNILDFTDVMAKLGATTNMSSQEASTALARLANITQMPQSQFNRLGSVIVALGNNLATTEAEIVEMGLRLAGAGKQVGMTEAQILGLSGALSSVGVEAQMGGSAFSRVMVDIQLAVETGSKRLNDFALVAGMSAEEFKRAFQEDAAGAIVAFVQGLGTAEERGISAIKVLDDMGITEIRLRDALLRAAGAGDLFRESIELGSAAWDENNALTKEAELRFGTAASQLQIFANEAKLTAAAFGEELAPVLLDLIEATKPYLEAFREMDSEQKKTIISLAAIAAAAGPVLWALGSMVGAVAKLMPVFKALGLLIGTIGAGPFALIAAAVAGVSAGVIWLQNKIEDLLGTENPIRVWVQAVVGGLGGQLGIIITLIRYWNDLRAGINKNIELIKSKIEQLKNIDLRQAGRNIIDSLIKGIKDKISAVASAMSSITKKIRNYLPFSPAKEGPLMQLPDFGNYFEMALKTAKTSIPASMESLLSEIKMPVPLTGIVGSNGSNDNRNYSRTFAPENHFHFYGNTSPRDAAREIERITQRQAIIGGAL